MSTEQALRDLLDQALDYMYNPFEPSNQGQLYKRLKHELAALALPPYEPSPNHFRFHYRPGTNVRCNYGADIACNKCGWVATTPLTVQDSLPSPERLQAAADEALSPVKPQEIGELIRGAEKP